MLSSAAPLNWTFQSTPALKGEGNRRAVFSSLVPEMFQSTPALKGEGNAYGFNVLDETFRFQSTPALKGEGNSLYIFGVWHGTIACVCANRHLGGSAQSRGISPNCQFTRRQRIMLVARTGRVFGGGWWSAL